MGITRGILKEHASYLSDGVRLERFAEAIQAVVKSGDVVVDLGAGTGILGLMACRAGAGRVYVIDDGSALELARALYRDNGFLERAVFLAGHSTHVDLPEQADVVLADQMAYFGYGAGLLASFEDARARFLKPEGLLLPSSIALFLAGVEDPGFEEKLALWSSKPAGFDAEAGRELLVAAAPWPVELEASHLLTSAEQGVEIVLGEAGSASFTAEVEVVATRDGVLHGLGGWFKARLAEDVSLTNSPLAEDRIKRSCGYFPLDPPIPLEERDRLTLRVQVEARSGLAKWSVAGVHGEGEGRRGVSQQQSTLASVLLSKADLQRRSPDDKPRLSALGEATRAALELCDGSRTLAEVRALIAKEHSDVLPSEEQVGALFHDLLERWAD